MLQSKRRRLGIVVATAAVALSLAACSSSTPGAAKKAAETADPNAKVTISVGGMPTSDQAASLAAFNQRITQFEQLHPNITIKPETTKWDPQTFAALVAGGTMPTEMTVPYTNIQQLAKNGQVKDITDLVKNDKTLSKLNPAIQKQNINSEGHIFGVTTSAYTLGLVYNRALYKQAGLDPDKPPTTWAEVRKNAKAITKATGQAGFAMSTTQNNGGWLLTGMSYSNGSLIQNSKGTKAAVDSSGVQASLDFLDKVRWTDDAAGSNFLMTQDDMRTAMAAGKIGQTVLGADTYNDLVGNRKMPASDVGIAALPQASDGLGTLGGGNIAAISPKATVNEAAAALEWVKYSALLPYIDKDAALTAAKTRSEDGLPVGAPMVPLFSDKLYQQYLGWISDYINVDQDHFAQYYASLDKLPIVPEPMTAAQDTYALLDSTVQKVLTDKGTDVASTLKQAQTQAQGLIDAAQ